MDYVFAWLSLTCSFTLFGPSSRLKMASGHWLHVYLRTPLCASSGETSSPQLSHLISFMSFPQPSLLKFPHSSSPFSLQPSFLPNLLQFSSIATSRCNLQLCKDGSSYFSVKSWSWESMDCWLELVSTWLNWTELDSTGLTAGLSFKSLNESTRGLNFPFSLSPKFSDCKDDCDEWCCSSSLLLLLSEATSSSCFQWCMQVNS